tara:strand:- start:1492 stop:1770 length:279 start_codon:yes stop_codon:yes gene_type:complete
MHCDFVNVYLRQQKIWVPDDPADPAGPGHWDWELQFQGGEMKFNEPDAGETWKRVGSVSKDTGTFTFDKDDTVEAMVNSLVTAMETAAGVAP